MRLWRTVDEEQRVPRPQVHLNRLGRQLRRAVSADKLVLLRAGHQRRVDQIAFVAATNHHTLSPCRASEGSSRADALA